MEYVKFLADNERLPKWEFVGGGEAGYESQHPPLYYALGAVVYKATSALPENWRWQAVRWFSLLIGIILILVARGFFDEYFRGRRPEAALAAAAVFATPLLLQYMSYVNPDIMSVLWSSVILWMCLRIARGEAKVRDRIVLTVAFGLGLITKLTVLGTLPLILVAHVVEPDSGRERAGDGRGLRMTLTVLGSTPIFAWWYVRCILIYHKVFVHTRSEMPSGLLLSIALGENKWWTFLKQTLFNTYWSTWVEPYQIPPTAAGFASRIVVTLVLITALVGAIVLRLRKSIDSPADERGRMLCTLFLAFLIVLHQREVWLVDYAYNAGGRYLLNGIFAIQALVVGTLLRIRFGRYWALFWITALVALNVLSIWYRLTVTNPADVPGWGLMKLTVPHR